MVRFEQMKEEDASKFLSISNNIEVKKYNLEMYVTNIIEAKNFIRNMKKRKNVKFFYKVVNEKDYVIGSIIGYTCGKDIIIAYIIGNNYRNKGYATQAIKQLLFELKEKSYQNVLATIHHENIASIKVVKKNGFIEEKKSKYGYNMYEKALN